MHQYEHRSYQHYLLFLNYMIKINKFPNILPIFPLSNFIFFPNTSAPLNIFEPRYIQMINESIKTHRMIGMSQPKGIINPNKPELFKVGCLGKISSFNETDDGRYVIILNGITRFNIVEEIENGKPFREFKVNYKKFETDLKESLAIQDIGKLIDKTKIFFRKSGLLLNWREFEKLDKIQQINTLSMISPVTNEEKQKLLESVSIDDKIKTLDSIISFYLHEVSLSNQTLQ